MAGDARELKVFQRAYRFSLELHRASLNWPRVEQYGGVADQLRRASKSVCALLVEGAGRSARLGCRIPPLSVDGDGIGRRSEAVVRLRRRSGLRQRETSLAWQAELSQIARMLQGSARQPV